MILRRLGNKSGIADKLQEHFPPHSIYIEPFFGAGGMFFNKPKVKYNIVNDLDSDVFNLFQVVSNQKEAFEEQFRIMPIHSDLFRYWKENKETDAVRKALRFLFLSCFTLHGAGGSFKITVNNDKRTLYDALNKTNELIFDVIFSNYDFRKFLNTLSFRGKEEMGNSFIYCDPPYIDTADNYSHSFKRQDATDLFDCLQETGCRFAYSEFENDFILEEVEKRKLNVITIGERRNLKKEKTEILVTNYKHRLTLF